MNCTKCGSDTKVIDSRGTKRRRECLTCQHRFSTVEVLWERGKPEIKYIEENKQIEKPKPVAKKTIKPPKQNSAIQLKKNASARRKIEDWRDSFLDPDYDYLPDKW